jgi:hypothetical protein
VLEERGEAVGTVEKTAVEQQESQNRVGIIGSTTETHLPSSIIAILNCVTA